MDLDALSKGVKSKSGKGKTVASWVGNKTRHIETVASTKAGSKAKKGQSREMARWSASTVRAAISLEIALPT